MRFGNLPDLFCYNTYMRYLVCVMFILIGYCSCFGQYPTSYLYSEDEEGYSEYDAHQEYVYMMLSMLLNIDQDPFEQASRYGFSAVRYNRRGYDYSFSQFNIGGIELNDALGGDVYWDIVRGLSDYMDMSIESFGVSERNYRPASFSARTDYDLWSDAIISRKRVGVIATDRNFGYGLNVKLADKFDKSGMYYYATASVRSGDDMHISGVWRDDLRFNLLLGRKWDDSKHEINVYGSAAPITQGLRGAATQECFELTGDNLYNPYWGYDESGEIVTSRVKDNFLPIAGVRYSFNPTQMFVMDFDMAAIVGTTSTQRLGWNGVANPYPDYYSYMPSYFANQDVADIVEAGWRDNDDSFTQVSWSNIYDANRGDGISPACYYLESDVRKMSSYQMAVSARYANLKGLVVKGGANININNSRYFKQLTDDLGGGFIYDTDPFVSMNDTYASLASNNMYASGLKIGVGDEFGYNYSILSTKAGAWFGVQLDKIPYSIDATIMANYNGFVRRGYYAKAIYDQSVTLGDSREYVFDDYGIVLGSRIRLSNNSHLKTQVTFGAKPADIDDIFYDVRYSEMAPVDVSSKQYGSFELVYRHIGDVDIFASIYGTMTRNESQVQRYYDDLSDMYMYAAFNNISKNYFGVEASAVIPLMQHVELLSAVGISKNTYADDISASVQSFLSGEIITENTISRMDGVKIGGSPQLVSNLKLSYSNWNMFNFSLGASLMADNYISASFVQRYDKSLEAALSPENQEALLYQQRFPAAISCDLSLSKTFEINQHFLSFYLMVNNIFDNRNIIYSGYEQNRLSSIGEGVNESVTAPDSKYYYGYGRRFYFSINFKL